MYVYAADTSSKLQSFMQLFVSDALWPGVSGYALNFTVSEAQTCLSKEREAHLNFRVFQHFVKVTPWVSENVLSPSQILSVCH